MVTALNRKLWRDLAHLKGPVLAISLVLASGVATFVMALSTQESLSVTKTTYFERYRLAQVFGHVKRAPQALADRIAEIPGVARVQTRIVADVTLDVPGLAEPAVGRLLSIPVTGRPALNDYHLRRGRAIEPGRAGEVLVNEVFVEANGFEPGQTLRAVLNGRRQELTIVGVVLSPEYVIQIQGGDLLPDDKRFGVFWMGESDLAAAFDMEGAFNDFSLTLMPGASEAEVIRQVDELLEPYGALGAYGRHDHVSSRYLSEEIKQLKTSATLAPTIFLTVAAFLLHVVLSRLITTQRQEIAALKAFGYSNTQVGWHYLKLVLLIVTGGGLLGIGVGAWLGHGLTQLYTIFYRFPIFQYQLDIGVVLLGLGVSAGAAVMGVLGAVLRAARLPPAQAMRPEPPPDYHPTMVERLGLQRFFSQTIRMILRHLERQPIKASLSVLGIALAAAILILGSFSKDALDYLMDFQFRLAQRQDLTVGLVEPRAARVLHEITHLPGVRRAEPFRSLPVRMRHRQHTRRLAIMGLDPGAELYRLLDVHERPVPLPPDGLVLSTKLAELLDARVGDPIQVEILEGDRPVRTVPVVSLVTEYSGTAAYMNRRALNRLAREGDNVSGAFLAVDAPSQPRLYRQLKSTPQVAVVTLQSAALVSFEETVAENLLRMRFFNVLFAAIIACGVVYNSARISLSERSRELATLRVIGFRRGEISMILLGELAILTLVAIPVGLALGYGLAAYAVVRLETELYRIPLVVHDSTYAFAASTVLVAALVSGLVVRRRVDHLDLIAVLKERE